MTKCLLIIVNLFLVTNLAAQKKNAEQQVKTSTEATTSPEREISGGNSREKQVEKRKQELKNKRQQLRVERNNCRKESRIERYSRRHQHRRVRTFTYDFNENRFVCEGSDANCGCANCLNHCGPPFEVDERDAIQLRFINVNPFLYTVQLYEQQGDQINSENLMESNWNKSLTVKFEKLPSLEIDRIFLQYSPDIEKNVTKTNALRDKLKDVQRIYENWSKPDSLRKSPETKTLDSLQKEISEIATEVYQAESTLRQIDENSQGIRKLEGILRHTLGEIQEEFRTINVLIDSHNLLIYVIHNPKNNFIELQQEIEKFPAMSIIEIRRKIDRLISSAHETISDLIKLDAILVKKNNGYSSSGTTYELIKSKLETVSRDFSRFDGVALAGQIEFMKAMVTKENFRVQYETHSIAENADFIRYRIEFRPNTLSENLTQGMSPFNMDIAFQIRQGWKYDISPGFVIDLGLKDPSYYFDKTTDPTGAKVYVRQSGDNGKATPAIAAFLNGYLRTSATVKAGGSFGLGVSSNGRFRMYFGPSFIIGRKERVVITGGASFGAISRLANGYKKGQELDNNSSLPAEVPMILDKYKLGGYIGIGFNLTGKKNQSFLQNLKFK